MDNIKSTNDGYQFIQDNPCKYYNSLGKCDIYKIRPNSCKNYPVSINGLCINSQCNNAIEIAVYIITKLIEECLELRKKIYS